jgi:hypothetical protein
MRHFHWFKKFSSFHPPNLMSDGEEIIFLILGDYQFEYAKSGRSACRITGNKIPNKALRVGRYEDTYEGHCHAKWMEFSAFEKSQEHVLQFQQSVSEGKSITGVETLKPADKTKVKALMSLVGFVAKPKPVQEDSEEESEEEEEEEQDSEESEEEVYYKKKRAVKAPRKALLKEALAPSNFSSGTLPQVGFNFGEPILDISATKYHEPAVSKASQNSWSEKKTINPKDAQKYRERIRNEEQMKGMQQPQTMDTSQYPVMPRFAQLDPEYASRILLTDLTQVEMHLMIARLVKQDPTFEEVLRSKIKKIVSQRK